MTQSLMCPSPPTELQCQEIKDAWILCAGKSTRCPGKLTQKFKGLTLPEHACRFAEANGLTPHVLTTQRYPGTAGCLDGRLGYVLFGDNYYHGHMPQHPQAHYTCSYRKCDGLAVVAGDKLIEKPHSFQGVHCCFTGYCYVDRWVPLQLSARGEYEITELLNKINARAVPLRCRWAHYSVPEDFEKVMRYVNATQEG